MSDEFPLTDAKGRKYRILATRKPDVYDYASVCRDHQFTRRYSIDFDGYVCLICQKFGQPLRIEYETDAKMLADHLARQARLHKRLGEVGK